MSCIMSVFYPLWYDAYRARIKDIVDTGQYISAKGQLETMVQEHVTWLAELGNPKNRVYGEQLMMEHALRHLDTVIDKNDPPYNDNGVIKHQSDNVKEALLQQPKTDYT